MDFTALQQGVMLAVTAVASVTFSIPQDPPHNGAGLTNPEIMSSYNLPKESSDPNSLQNLNALTQPVTDQLKMVVKEAKALEVITVEQPPIMYTVVEPTPKPTAKPSEIPKSEDTEQNPDSSAKPSPKPETDTKSETKSPDSSAAPSPSPITAALTSSNADILFQMTNDYRSKMGKPAFEKEDRLCKIAEARAPMVNGELSAGTLHKGFRELNLPYWATENLAAYATMKENFNFLVTDYIHKVAIESDHKYSCTACVGTSCSQIFSSFVNK